MMKAIILYICMLFSCNAKGQAYISQCLQLGVYNQTIGVMGGYELDKASIAFNYAQGIKYTELSLFAKWVITRQADFNFGLSEKIGFVNGNFGVFYPALEAQWGVFQIAFRPINNGLISIEPRVKIKF